MSSDSPSSVRPSVRPSVCLSVCNAVHCGSQGPSTVVPACSQQTRSYLSVQTLLPQNAPKKTSRRKCDGEFFETQTSTPAPVCSTLHMLLTEIVRKLWSVTLQWIEFGCVRELYEELDCLPAVRIGLNL